MKDGDIKFNNESRAELSKGRTTICIVNYKTELLTKLCLRSIRKYTGARDYEVIVVDNDSADSSLDYLRRLKWIRLFERTGQVMRSGSWAHGTGLDVGLENAAGEYFIAMHSDSIVRREGWLDFLLAKIAEADYACAGSGKLDLKPRWLETLKKMTDVKKWIRHFAGQKRNDFYIRTICAIYNTQILRKENLKFSMRTDEGVTCGKQIYYELMDRGCRTNPIDQFEAAGYMHHLAHATMVLNPEFTVRSRTRLKYEKKMRQILSSPEITSILNDSSLDQ
mgnify:CR=1 FL=1